MKSLIRACLLAVASGLVGVVGQVPIPYTNCGGPNDMVKIESATASVWPPSAGQSVTLTLSGSLAEQLSGGTYAANATVDGFPVINQSGNLANLDPSIKWPIPAGPMTFTKTLTLPSLLGAGTSIVIGASAMDNVGNELLCIGLSFTVGSGKAKAKAKAEESLFDARSSDAEIEAVFEWVASAAQKGKYAQQVFKVGSHDVVVDSEGAMETIDRQPAAVVDFDLVGDVPVPYSNCGSGSDAWTIQSITCSQWPPQLGTTAWLNITLTSSETVTSGQYAAKLSVDGIPLGSKSGDLSQYVAMPVAAGPVTIAKDIKLPSSIPFSGSIGLQLSAGDQNNNELFCLAISFDF